MNILLAILTSILFLSGPFTFKFNPCRLICKSGLTRDAYSKIPDMMDNTITYKEEMNSIVKEVSSDIFTEIVFTKDGQELIYKRVLTYSNYGNKNVNESDSWLKVLKTGYLSLYYGYEPGLGGPSYNLWYFKKDNDPIAYYITMKYSGGIGITIGTGNNFKENASFYLSDYKDLSDKISNGEYKFEDIELVVDIYNKWHDTKWNN
jgi:hypothetical protein